jgi:hypothetical protein
MPLRGEVLHFTATSDGTSICLARASRTSSQSSAVAHSQDCLAQNYNQRNYNKDELDCRSASTIYV